MAVQPRPRQHGRTPLHHHAKHAATFDGHRPDDPHGVTAPQHEVYDDETDYGQSGPYAKVATEGQWEDRIQASKDAEAKSRKETGFSGHIGINEFLGMGTPAGNAAGRARQEAGAAPKPERNDDPLGDKGSYKGHIGINEYLDMGSPEGNRIAAARQEKGAKEKEDRNLL